MNLWRVSFDNELQCLLKSDTSKEARSKVKLINETKDYAIKSVRKARDVDVKLAQLFGSKIIE